MKEEKGKCLSDTYIRKKIKSCDMVLKALTRKEQMPEDAPKRQYDLMSEVK